MDIFKELLQEALQEKQFTDYEEFTKAVKSILRKASFPKYKETKASSEKGYGAPIKFGYKYKCIDNDITVSFFGAERSWINELAHALTKAKINYHYNDRNEIFLITAKDNLKPDAYISDEAMAELESGEYKVLGTSVAGKNDISKITDKFDATQKSIYKELIDNGLIEWKIVKLKLGEITKFKYRLVKVEDK
jgi:peptidyl-tRNA hydrolase